MKKIITLLALSCFAIPSAFAQQVQYEGGMHYTAMSRAQPSQNQNDEHPLYNRQDPTPSAKDQNQNESAIPKEEQAIDPIWKKYKELATGINNEDASDKRDTTAKKPKKPKKPTQAAEDESEQEERPQTGIASIIADYQRSKEERGQIHHIQISKPQAPSVETPKVETPSVKDAK